MSSGFYCGDFCFDLWFFGILIEGTLTSLWRNIDNSLIVHRVDWVYAKRMPLPDTKHERTKYNTELTLCIVVYLI